jgi:hypothetical protein
MYIEINVHLGDDEFSEVYEKATATTIIEAEAELIRIGRHYIKDVQDGKINESDRSAADFEKAEEQEDA